MRLQLCIIRHELPPVQILWTALHSSSSPSSSQHPHAIESAATTAHNNSSGPFGTTDGGGGSGSALQLHSSAGDNGGGGGDGRGPSSGIGGAVGGVGIIGFGGGGGTSGKLISELLEDVDAVMPLTTPDQKQNGWGLESYAVRIGDVEALHFQNVRDVLRDGDRVTIQYRSSHEIKEMRLGGRLQISSDGKHLIDGIPFGRSYLRRPATRPPVSIPPLKKRLQLEWEPEPRVFVNTDIPDEESDEDEDYVEGGDEEESEDDEMDDADASEALEDEDKENVPNRQIMLRTDFDDADADVDFNEEDQYEGLNDAAAASQEDEWEGIQSSQEAPNDSMKDVSTMADMGDGRRRAKRLKVAHNGSKTGLTWIHPEANLNGTVSKRRPGLRSSQIDASEFVQLESESEDDSDDDSQSTTRLDSEVSKVPNPPGLDKLTPNDDETSSSGTSSSESSTDSDSDDMGVSDSDVESDSDSGSSESEASSTSTSSSSSSSSEDESEDEDISSSSPSKSAKKGGAGTKSKSASTSDDTISAPGQKASRLESTTVKNVNPPNQGLRRTKSSNRRKKLAKMKKAGKLPPEATVQDMLEYVARQHGSEGKIHSPDDHETTAKASSGAVSSQAAFEARRQKLLDAIAFGGVEVDPLDEELVNYSILSDSKLPIEKARSAEDLEAISNSVLKRTKLDVSSAQRMIFGSLGVRAPKTKADEEATRMKLAGQIRTPLDSQRDRAGALEDANVSTLIDDVTPANKVLVPDSQTDEEAWQKKLIVKAVECCYDGVELSAPPFPFVQRWDPQQQPRGQKRKRGNGGSLSGRFFDRQRRQSYDEPDIELNYDDGMQSEPRLSSSSRKSDNGAIRDQLMREAHDLSATAPDFDVIDDDMPPLPDDIENYPKLGERNATFGSIIAYQVLHIGADTSWGPGTKYLTAHIDRVEEDGKLKLTLARRDWDKTPAKKYDENGNRIYDKFEMPSQKDEDEEEESEVEDDGKRYFYIHELENAKLVKAGEPYFALSQELSAPIGNGDDTNLREDGNDEGDVALMPEQSFTLQTDEDLQAESRIASEQHQADERYGNSQDLRVEETLDEKIADNPSAGEFIQNEEALVEETPGVTNQNISSQEEEAVVEETQGASSPAKRFLQTSSIATPDRAEISNLISDAGFRQSVDSRVAWPAAAPEETSAPVVEDHGDGAVEDAFTPNENLRDRSLSPRFNGFTTSPSTRDRKTPSPRKSASNIGSKDVTPTPKLMNKTMAFDTPGYPKLPQSSPGTKKHTTHSVDEEQNISSFYETPAMEDYDADIGEDSLAISSDLQNGQRVQSPNQDPDFPEDDSLLKPISLSKDNSCASEKFSANALDDNNTEGVNDSHNEPLTNPDHMIASTAPARIDAISPPPQRTPKKTTSSKTYNTSEFRKWPLRTPSKSMRDSTNQSPSQTSSPLKPTQASTDTSSPTKPQQTRKQGSKFKFSSQHAGTAAAAAASGSQNSMFMPSWDRSRSRDSPPPPSFPPVSSSASSSLARDSKSKTIGVVAETKGNGPSGKDAKGKKKSNQIVDLTQMNSSDPVEISEDEDGDDDDDDDGELVKVKKRSSPTSPAGLDPLLLDDVDVSSSSRSRSGSDIDDSDGFEDFMRGEGWVRKDGIRNGHGGGGSTTSSGNKGKGKGMKEVIGQSGRSQWKGSGAGAGIKKSLV